MQGSTEGEALQRWNILIFDLSHLALWSMIFELYNNAQIKQYGQCSYTPLAVYYCFTFFYHLAKCFPTFSFMIHFCADDKRGKTEGRRDKTKEWKKEEAKSKCVLRDESDWPWGRDQRWTTTHVTLVVLPKWLYSTAREEFILSLHFLLLKEPHI